MRIVKEKCFQLRPQSHKAEFCASMNLNEGNLYIKQYVFHFISDFITNGV